jgi:NTE family protein
VTRALHVAGLPRPIAFALGGGASSAAAQVGMLAALAEHGIVPDLIVGTSAGALNGVILADDPADAVARLRDIWTTMDMRRVIPDSRLRKARQLIGRVHMYRNEGLAALFEQNLSARTFAELSLPFACVATDLDEGSAVILDEGALLDALLATCAIPGVFPTVIRNGRSLVDGLCVANLPVRQALELGAGSIIALDGRPSKPLAGPRRDVRDTMAAAFATVVARQTVSDLEYVAERVPVWSVPGQPAAQRSAFQFGDCAQLIEDAYDAASVYLSEGLRVELGEAG